MVNTGRGCLTVAVSAFILGGAGAWLSAVCGSRWGMLDIPTQRSSHVHPVPKGGGIGILWGFISSSLLLRFPLTFWLPGVIVSLLGLWGDRHDIRPALRLCIQFAACLMLLGGAIQDNAFGLMTGGDVTYPGLPHVLINGIRVSLAAVFMVGTANFYNFMDGIDGIAAMTGIIAFVLLFFQSAVFPDKVLCLSLALGCLGFLPFNFPKARVFMGDAGSILLGFCFAAMIFRISADRAEFVCMASFLFPFYADVLTTMGIRIKAGENITQPHRRHLYQILVNEFGFTHWSVSIAYGMMQLIVAMGVLMMKNYGITAVLMLLLFFFVVFCAVSFHIRNRMR